MILRHCPECESHRTRILASETRTGVLRKPCIEAQCIDCGHIGNAANFPSINYDRLARCMKTG